MAKKTAVVPVLSDSEGEEKEMPVQTHPRQRKFASLLGFWFVIVLVLGAVIVIVVSSVIGYWLHDVQASTTININTIGNPATPPVPVTTFKVDRSAAYAGLNMAVVNAQYATSFGDDLIHPGSAIVRLNMQITNATSTQINVVYYSVARLLAPGQAPISPTNMHLSVGPRPGTSEKGWIDFSVSQTMKLDALMLQLGSAPLDELLVKIPFSGPFNAAQYSDRVLKPGAEFDYTYNGYTLNYHLTSMEIREAYQGSQCKSGQRFYIFNFRVDNQSGVDVSPGLGFDYMRMVVGAYGNPPVDNTLPATFKAGRTATGRVVFAAPAGVHNFSLRFLYQLVSGQQDYPMSI
ncbi:MAG: hypothetical protein JO215_12730 [Ktedonobacteraceae bacterium]|nr:hypothetical protein [Ktedonobacteraceae bacterium]